jgi:hypothetical protein
MVISLVASTRGVALLPASCIRRGTTMWRSKRAVFKMMDDSGPKLSSVSRKPSYRGPIRDRHWECPLYNACVGSAARTIVDGIVGSKIDIVQDCGRCGNGGTARLDRTVIFIGNRAFHLVQFGRITSHGRAHSYNLDWG